MGIKREWATPITAGAFMLSAVTGILMFFHLDTGLNKEAHEWLSWALLTGVLMHVTSNFAGFKKHFSMRRGPLIIGLFAVLLSLSFIPVGEKDEPPFVMPLQVMSQASLTTLAQVANSSPEQLRARLDKAGIETVTDQQSVRDLVGDDFREQVRVLRLLLKQE